MRLSKRFIRHPSLDGKSLLEKYELIPEIFGRVTSKDWTPKDQKRINSILDSLDKLGTTQTKTVSTKFYEKLYEHEKTYNKVASFARGPRLLNSFSHLIKIIRNPRFCSVCDSCFVQFKSPICYLCGKLKPEQRETIINRTLSNSHVKLWTPEYKAERIQQNIERWGVRSSRQLENTKRKRVATLIARLGEDWQQILVERKNKTVKERYNVDCVLQIQEVRDKAKQTLLKTLGVDHQMKDQATFLKAMAKSRFIYKGKVNGRRFKVQGKSEIQVAKILCDKNGTYNVHSQFHKEYPDDVYKRLGTFPDFYIESSDTFVQ